MPSLRSTAIAVLALIAGGNAVLALATCGGEPPPAPAVPPAGAVVRVGPDQYLSEPGWILAEEVDRWVDTIALVQPTETRLSWQRKALTNIVLPMRQVALVFPEERDEVRGAVQALHAAALAGELTDEDIERTEGHFLQVGLDRWGVARTLPAGEWSEVFETVAGFSFLRVLEAPPAEKWDGGTQIVIEHVTRYFLELEVLRATVEDIQNKLKVSAVDPDSDWAWILPQYYQYK